ncbi:MAG: VanZ family protein [Chitinophagales bacterium]|nr:VanZ family protein [Chitinophagales bacterium]
MPALMWAAVIFTLSTGNSIQAPRLTNLFEPDKLAHAAAYFVLTAFISWGFIKTIDKRWAFMWWAALISSLYGLAMEIIQYSFFVNRHFEVYDIIANIIGALICIFVIRLFIK